MEKSSVRYFIASLMILLMYSCMRMSPEQEMQDLSRLYGEKKITNSQMLFEMGKIFREHQENGQVKKDYFNRLIISGYTSHIIHHYLLTQERNLQEDDMKILLFAMKEGNHYEMADLFSAKFSGNLLNQLNQMRETNDSLIYYDTVTERIHRAEAYLSRSGFFTRLGETEMARADIETGMAMEPCLENAVFQQALLLFQQEKTREIIGLLEKCNSIHTDWYPVFYRLAFEIESVKNSGNPAEEKLFKQANLYVNNGFADIALRKNSELLGMKGESNPDYLALQAFIYYRLKNRKMAERYVEMAEGLTGKKTRLGEMIAEMK